MRRRQFLGFLGAAPIAAIGTKQAVASGGFVVKAKPFIVGEVPSESIVPLGNVGQATAGTLHGEIRGRIVADFETGRIRFVREGDA